MNDTSNNNSIVPSSQDDSFNPPSNTSAGGVQSFINTGTGPQIANNSGPIFILDPSNPSVIQALNSYFPGVISSLPSATEWASLSDQQYNVFVLDNESFRDNSFCMPKRFCLTEDMTDISLIKHYKDLDSSQRDELYKMPCIFAGRNSVSFKTAGPSQPIVIGRIREIVLQTDNIKFLFDAYKTDIGQQLFNDHASDIGIADVFLRNELDVEHWSIKEGNLKKFINDHGIIIG